MARQASPVDRGWSWVILVASFFIYMCVIGGHKCFGILYAEMVEYFGTSSGDTAWIYGVMLCLNQGLGPVSNFLCTKFTFRKIVIVGGLFMCTGYMTSSFVSEMQLMYITLGVITGIGCGLSFVPSATIVGLYFKKRRALAIGLVVCGSGVGNTVIPYMYRSLLDTYGLKGCLLIVSAVYLNICVAASCFRQPTVEAVGEQERVTLVDSTLQCQHEDNSDSGVSVDTRNLDCGTDLTNQREPNVRLLIPESVNMENPGLTEQQTVPSECNQSKSERIKFDCTIVWDPLFLLYSAALILGQIGYGIYYFIFVSHCEQIGISKQTSSTIFSIVGVTELFSRIFLGWFTDLKLINPRYIFCGITAFCGVTSCFIPFASNELEMGAFGIMFGASGGTFFVFVPVLIIEALGVQRFTSAFGLTTFFWAFASLTTIPLAGWLKDLTGSWKSGFLLVGAAFCLSSVILLLEPILQKMLLKRKMRLLEKDIGEIS